MVILRTSMTIDFLNHLYIPRTLELFVHSLLSKAMHITCARQAKTLSPAHMLVLCIFICARISAHLDGNL